MRYASLLCVLSISVALAAGCSGDGDTGDDVLDVRVEIPAPDSAFVDLVTPEVVIEPGEEKMYCVYIDNDLPDFAVSQLLAFQGNYGHHVVLLTTLEPEPPGTFEDCTDAEDMSKFRAFILPDIPLPDGHGILVPEGLQYVLQFHYVNASDRPILVRDVARLRVVDVEDVEVWTTTLTTNSLAIDIPAALPGSETFDCEITEAVDLLLVGGHLHEQGSKFEILVGPDTDSLESVYLVDPWRPEYRDAPPVTLMFTDPMRLEPGTIVRTDCHWQNNHQRGVSFPEEMCSTFGYVAGTAIPVHCEAN
jgi:hypothetical protein